MPFSRRSFLAGVIACAPTGVGVRLACAQRPARVGYLSHGPFTSAFLQGAEWQGLVQGLREAGFVEGTRLPSIFHVEEYAERGDLAAFGPRRGHMFYRAGVQAGKILRGSRPAEIPVEQPTEFDLTINTTTARRIGVEIPPSVLLRANRTIE